MEEEVGEVGQRKCPKCDVFLKRLGKSEAVCRGYAWFCKECEKIWCFTYNGQVFYGEEISWKRYARPSDVKKITLLPSDYPHKDNVEMVLSSIEGLINRLEEFVEDIKNHPTRYEWDELYKRFKILLKPIKETLDKVRG